LKLYVIGFRTGTSPKILKNITVNELWKDGPLYLLLTRQDGQWQIGYSNTGQSWSQVGLFTFPLSVTQAGFFAGNFNTTPGNEPAFTTVVDYYFDANVPVVPEDADPLMLPVNVIGNGSVSKDRTCGNPVQLTAEPDSGWHFVEWQGAPIDGNSSLVVTTPFSFGDEVTALFEIGEPQMYSLDVQTSGQGTVTQVPDKTEYLAGEAVALTAVPGEGWLFDSWSVDLSGTDPEQTITMDSDKTVVAKFVQDIVSLDIEVEGPGHVQITPQGPYQNGDKVTLMAVPDGKLSTFVGWSGDRVSEDNPLKLTMTEDLSLTATFIIYKQFLPFTLSPFSE